MSQKFLTLDRVWVVLAGSKVNVRAPGVRDRSQRGSLLPDVHAHVREVRAKRCLHLRAHVIRYRQTTAFLTQRNLKRFYARSGLSLYRSRGGTGCARALREACFAIVKDRGARPTRDSRIPQIQPRLER